MKNEKRTKKKTLYAIVFSYWLYLRTELTKQKLLFKVY